MPLFSYTELLNFIVIDDGHGCAYDLRREPPVVVRPGGRRSGALSRMAVHR